MPDVFISYCRRDKERVGRIRNGLESSSLETWWDGDLAPSVEFSSDIDEQLASTKHVLVAWSSLAGKSLYVKAEALRALDSGKLVQVMLDESPLPVPFNALNALDLRTWRGDLQDPSWSRLLNAFKGGSAPAEGATRSEILRVGVSAAQIVALWTAPLLMLCVVVAGVLAALNILSSSQFVWIAAGGLGVLLVLLLSLMPAVIAAFRGR